MTDSDRENKFYFAKSKTNGVRRCKCPSADPGKIVIDISAHLPGCWLRKRLLSKRFTIDTSAIPSECNDGYQLGVATN